MRQSKVIVKRVGVGVLAALMLLEVNASSARAQTLTIDPGEYITERGWGTLDVTSPAGKEPSFFITAIGANAHTCELGGDIRNGEASLEAGENERCIVTFVTSDSGIAVSSNEACRFYCGARASFDGLYLKIPKECTDRGRSDTHAAFKRLYDEKKFAEARSTLEPLLSQCGRTLDWQDAGWDRNDLALTQHKLGDDATCLETLSPLAADAAKTDEEISAAYPPSDADAYLPIVKATRTNLKLCSSGKPH